MSGSRVRLSAYCTFDGSPRPQFLRIRPLVRSLPEAQALPAVAIGPKSGDSSYATVRLSLRRCECQKLIPAAAAKGPMIGRKFSRKTTVAPAGRISALPAARTATTVQNTPSKRVAKATNSTACGISGFVSIRVIVLGSQEFFGAGKSVKANATVGGIKVTSALMPSGQSHHFIAVSSVLRNRLGKDVGDGVEVLIAP